MSKICPTCKKEIEDNLTICNLCGCPVPEQGNEIKSIATDVQPNFLVTSVPQEMQREKRIDIISIIISSLGMASGLLSIIFGIVMLLSEKGYTEILTSYGGDAYTGIQNAAAQTANNIYYFNQNVKLFAFFLLFVAGLVLILVFLNRLINTIKKAKEG